MWYVYLLLCRDSSYYCGITNDIQKRLKQHNSGKGSKYVASRSPAMVVYVEPSENRSTASKREYAIKKLTRAEKEAIITESKRSALCLE